MHYVTFCSLWNHERNKIEYLPLIGQAAANVATIPIGFATLARAALAGQAGAAGAEGSRAKRSQTARSISTAVSTTG